MAEKLWKKIEAGSIVDGSPIFLDDTDDCFFALDYVSGGGWKAGQGNQVISNLKKHISKLGTPEWPHKERAIAQFAGNLARLLPAGATLCPAVTSKTEEDPEYDDRLVRVVERAATQNGGLIVERPLAIRATVTSSHAGGARNPHAIYENLVWRGYSGEPPETLFIIDDVVTTGAHFKAQKRLIVENHPGTEVTGIFCARTVWPNGDEFE